MKELFFIIILPSLLVFITYYYVEWLDGRLFSKRSKASIKGWKTRKQAITQPQIQENTGHYMRIFDSRTDTTQLVWLES